jgi:hypothetical protein
MTASAQGPPITVRQLLRADPIGHLLLVKGRLHYLVLALLCLVLLALLLIVLPIRFPQVPPEATSQHPADFFSTLDGLMMVVSWLVFVPVVWGFYAWQSPAIVKLHEKLHDCLKTEAAMTSPMRFSSWYQNPLWSILAGLLALWEFRRFMSPDHVFTNAGPWVFHSTVLIRAAFVLLASLTYYMVVMLVVRQVITTISLNRLFNRESVPVRFLHPDECAGFRFLGEHAMGIAPLIAAAGLNLSLVYVRIIGGGELGSNTTIYTLPAISLLYLVGSIAVFTAPLWSAHKEMLQARDRWLDDIAKGFELQQLVVQGEMYSGNLNPASVAKLEAAVKARDIGRSFPTWPLNVGNARKFMATLLSPLVPIGIVALQQLLGVKKP